MSHDSRAVAEYLRQKAQQSGSVLTPLQLIKLTYLSHGWTLGLTGRPLLHEDIEAWQYGPVIRNLYRAVSHAGRSPVTRPVSDHTPTFAPVEQNITDQVFQKYGHLSGTQLSALTHQKDTPWDYTWRQYGQNAVIPQDWIEKYYRHIANERSAGSARAS